MFPPPLSSNHGTGEPLPIRAGLCADAVPRDARVCALIRARKVIGKNMRFIALSLRAAVYTGKAKRCVLTRVRAEIIVYLAWHIVRRVESFANAPPLPSFAFAASNRLVVRLFAQMRHGAF